MAHTATLPAVLVGCSLGSAVAQEMYHLRPEGVGGLVLTGTGFVETSKNSALSANIAGYEERGAEFRRHQIRAGFSPSFQNTSAARWFTDVQMDGTSHTNVDVIMNLMRSAASSRRELIDIEVPVLIVSGSADFMHEAAHELQRRLRGSRFEVIEDVGHVAPVEAPDEFDRALEGLLLGLAEE